MNKDLKEARVQAVGHLRERHSRQRKGPGAGGCLACVKMKSVARERWKWERQLETVQNLDSHQMLARLGSHWGVVSKGGTCLT